MMSSILGQLFEKKLQKKKITKLNLQPDGLLTPRANNQLCTFELILLYICYRNLQQFQDV